MSKKDFRKRRVTRHFSGFIDRHRWPDFSPTDNQVKWFHTLQSEGKKSLSAEQLDSLEPLIWAQKSKEITIKGLVSEMAEWWCKGWGWWYPMEATVTTIKGDWMFKAALLRIRRQIETKGFLGFLESFTGLSFSEKQRYVGFRLSL